MERNLQWARKAIDDITKSLEVVPPKAWVLQYHINGIQEYIGASRKLRVIGGASQLINHCVRKYIPEALSKYNIIQIFGAAGRGSFLVPDESQLRGIKEAIEECVAKKTLRQSVGVAYGPLAQFSQLEAKVAQSKALAPAVVRRMEGNLNQRCEACGVGAIERDPETKDNLCEACIACTKDYYKHRGLSTNHISHRGRLAYVAADGNQLSHFFGNHRDSPRDYALASLAVDYVIAGATEDAQIAVEQQEDTSEAQDGQLSAKDKCLCPIIGGDDVQALLSPKNLKIFLRTFFTRLNDRRQEIASELKPGGFDVETLYNLSVGMGVVVVDDHAPVRHMRQWAHTLERFAKKQPCEQSMVAFASIFNSADIKNPFVFPAKDLERVVQNAQALARVPASQRARFTAGSKDNPELKNFFRYQVARDRAWQTYVNEKKDKDGHTYDLNTKTEKLIPSRGEAELAEWLGQK